MNAARLSLIGLPIFAILILIGAPAKLAHAQGSAQPSSSRPSVMDRIQSKVKEINAPSDQAKRWFNNLDNDKSGDITKSELFESIRRRFEILDKNRDALVSKSEYLSTRKDGNVGGSRFGKLDSNGDGQLDRREFAAPADWRFDRIDRNLDGKISQPEAERLFDRPEGKSDRETSTRCFFIERQVVRVTEEVAESLEKKGFAKADCNWVPDTTEQTKSEKYIK